MRGKIYSQLSRLSAARGLGMKFSLVEPTKVKSKIQLLRLLFQSFGERIKGTYQISSNKTQSLRKLLYTYTDGSRSIERIRKVFLLEVFLLVGFLTELCLYIVRKKKVVVLISGVFVNND